MPTGCEQDMRVVQNDRLGNRCKNMIGEQNNCKYIERSSTTHAFLIFLKSLLPFPVCQKLDDEGGRGHQLGHGHGHLFE